MKALKVTIERLLDIKKKLTDNPAFKYHLHEVLEYDENLPDLNLINDDWVKIRVKLGGICGSDLGLLSMKTSTVLSNFSSFPAIPGHEIVGEIMEIGGNVGDLSIGDRVIIDENLSCEIRGLDYCDSCKTGDYSLCSNFDKGAIAPGAVTGFCMDTGGGWGEYLVAHKYQVFKIPNEVSNEDALIAEPLACAIHAILKKLPKENETCVVIGCGTIGMVSILALKALSKCKIIAVARYPHQSEMAKQLGADEVFIAKKDMHIKKIGRLLGARVLSPVMEDAYPVGGGADIVIDSVGNANSVANCLRLVKAKGTVIILGYPAYMNIDWTPITAKEITIIASNIFSHDIIKGKKHRTLQIALDLIADGVINVKNFITHKFPLEKYKDALDMTASKSENVVVKVVFEF